MLTVFIKLSLENSIDKSKCPALKNDKHIPYMSQFERRLSIQDCMLNTELAY